MMKKEKEETGTMPFPDRWTIYKHWKKGSPPELAFKEATER